MKSDTTDKILANLEAEITFDDMGKIEPLLCCQWVASSTWQKSMRRGLTETALRAAVTFWRADCRGFYRRCLLACVEDVGVGSLDVTTKVLTACANPAWRKRVGDLRTALHLTRLMCAANKSRLGDQTYIIAERAPEYASLRSRLAVADNKGLADNALNQKSTLTERLVAFWLLAGTARRFPSDRMPARTGSLEMAIEVLRSLNVSSDLTAACIVVLTKTQYPLPLFLPVLAQTVQRMSRPLCVSSHSITTSPEVSGIPHFAADQFTRLGKTCIRQLQQSVPGLKQFSPAQIGLGVFYAEGGKVDRELTGPELDDFREMGEIADIESTSLCLPRYLGLRECLEQHWKTFEEIRRKELHRYLDQWRDEQQFEERLI